MACWVVPGIAAEYWHVSVDHILRQIAEGKIRSKSENGFTFVDVLPDAVRAGIADGQENTPTPMTFVAVSREEMNALADDGDGIESEDGPIDWRPGRRKAASTRKRPLMRAA